jgi:pseudouridine-5'-phosphate glycosidase
MKPRENPRWLKIHPEVEAALAEGLPIVALESTVITHGLPKPTNIETALQMQSEVREGGAIPATVAVLSGRIHLGIETNDLERLALSSQARKVSIKDLGSTVSHRSDGGTTVAATLFVAHAAGVRVFATGGIGGVHRGGEGDVSADLPALARSPVAVVCSGAKGFLDLPRTLEWLETAGVPVIGFQTTQFPAFFSRHSGLALSEKADLAQEAADILAAHWKLGLQSGALVCVPCPQEAAIAWDELQIVIAEVEAEAAADGVSGPTLSPFILERLGSKTGGATLQANVALLRQNARVAAEIASLM